MMTQVMQVLSLRILLQLVEKITVTVATKAEKFSEDMAGEGQAILQTEEIWQFKKL